VDLSGEIDFDEFVDYVFNNDKKLESKLQQEKVNSCEDAERRAKAKLLAKDISVRNAASAAVKARGGNWRTLSWAQRLHKVHVLEGCAPEDDTTDEDTTDEEPEDAGRVRKQDTGNDAFDVTQDADAPAKPAVKPAKMQLPTALVGSPSRRRSSTPGIAEMSQTSIIDYSVCAEDLSFAGACVEAQKELFALKEEMKSLGDFSDVLRVKKYLAKGTAGKVFLAEDLEGGDKVALKLIRMTQARTGMKEWYMSKLLTRHEVPNVVSTFETVRVMPKFSAPPVIAEQLMDAGPVPYYMCLMQEFMNGGTLEGLAEEGRLDCCTMLSALEDVSKGLAVMHEIKIQHRDVKPENVLLEVQNGHVVAKLCDFGQAEFGLGHRASAAGRKDDIRRYGVTLFSVAAGEGWTRNRLIREPHDQLVARLRDCVAGTSQVSQRRLPELLEMILAGDQGMREIANAIGELRVQAAADKG